MEELIHAYDVCVVCALYEEAHAVIDEFSLRCGVTFATGFRSKSHLQYRYATIQNQRGESLTIFVTWLSRIGPISTVLDLVPLLQEIHPRFVAMTGICAGDRTKVKVGDLIIATGAYHLEEGKKTTSPDGIPLHWPEISIAGATRQVLQYVVSFDGWREPLGELHSQMLTQAKGSLNETMCHLGVMASSMAVHADHPFATWTNQYHRKTIAVDMEAAAFYLALRDVPLVHGLVVKGVSDYGDSSKDDTYHNYAARASAVYLLTFIQHYVTEETMPRRDVPPARPSAVWNVPYPRNPHFTGRDELLERLDRHFSGKAQGNPNRQRLLRKVQAFWIRDVLEQSLHHATLIALRLEELPEAVENPWRLVFEQPNKAKRLLPRGMRITQVYEQSNGELLLLGEPGSGKTTLLLELARDLLAQAEQDHMLPMPVIFHLSSWAGKQLRLTEWLEEELNTKYQVPRRLGKAWIAGEQILPLLDGLDEVAFPQRAACIKAINTYRQDYGLLPIVVCSRSMEYFELEDRLHVRNALNVQPLTQEQREEYLNAAGEPLTGLRMAFSLHAELQELATTPLMLSILALSFHGKTIEQIDTASFSQKEVLHHYVERMLQRRSVRSHYRPQQTIYWLSYLAWQMKRQSQTVLYIERMQPSWLMKKWQRQLYAGLIAGPIWGLLVGLVFLFNPPLFLLAMLITTLIVGLLFGWISEPQIEKSYPANRMGMTFSQRSSRALLTHPNQERSRANHFKQPPSLRLVKLIPHSLPDSLEKKGIKTIAYPWMRMRQSLATALESRMVIGIIAGLTGGTANALYSYLVDYPYLPFGSRITPAIGYGLIIGIFVGVPLGLAIRLERRIEPMEALGWSWIGIRRDIARWLLIGISIGSIQGLLFALPLLLSGQSLWIRNFVIFGSWATINFVLVITLINGVKRGLSKRILDAQHVVTPNQGIWRSARYGAVMAIIIGAISIVFAGAGDLMRGFGLPLANYSVIDHLMVDTMSHLLGFSPTTRQEFLTLHILFIALRSGAILSLAAGLYCGGAAYVQHFILRFLLWRAQYVPFNYLHFLDYAAERILLHKVGGSYIFIHRLLLEYFASLWDHEGIGS